MGDSKPMVVLRQGDWVLWQDGGESGIGRISMIEEALEHYSTYVYVASPEAYGNPITRSKKLMRLPIKCCTKIDAAIAKVYGHNNV